ncbi:MAG: phosphoribosylformylglycinamidine synthase subunit PurL [Euryarchaeota archaeon]|nr:phosphoribosylformylglycinamidine synthase subunit PurL [Euryarchaeota archaeon]
MTTTEAAIQVSLTPEEIELAKKRMGRKLNSTELFMVETMWSEHCSYKSSRPLLKLFTTTGKHVLVGPGYDAGAIDIGDGWAVVTKIESHNHPSAIEPYSGAATGIGGIVRDILSLGARPIALLDSLRFGSIEKERSRYLFDWVVKGIADYGNRIGVPTVAGEVEFDEGFEFNPLVNVMCVGIVPKDKIVKAIAEHPGDSVILVGSSTGRDGIHGVTFASAELTAAAEEVSRPAVQIGDPFTKKLLIEAVLEALASGKVHGLKDLGGGGLTCASSEMSSKGNTGMEIDISKIPKREPGMVPYEVMLSESQERMLLIVEPGSEEEFIKIFQKYDLNVSVIGKVTDTGFVVVKDGDKIIAKVQSRLLAEDSPVVYREAKVPIDIEKLRDIKEPLEPADLKSVFLKVLASPTIASKEWIYRQYDHEVQIRTVIKPGYADAAVLRIADKKGIAIKTDCNSLHVKLDPYYGGAGAVAEAARNLVCVGAEPAAIVDCLNFGNPEKPEVFWQFSEAVRGMADMAKGLEIPVIGGNVSFYNETEGVAVNPAPVVGMVGVIEDIAKSPTMGFKNSGNGIVIIGETKKELGGSQYYLKVHGIRGGYPPKTDPPTEKQTLLTILETIKSGYALVAHDCSEGGLAVALVEMAIVSGLGFTIDLAKVLVREPLKDSELLFSESHSRIVLEVKQENIERVRSIAKKFGVKASVVGEVTKDPILIIKRDNSIVLTCALSDAQSVWTRSIPSYM